MKKEIKKTKQILKCCYGISSYVDKNKHVFMIDYDNVKLEDVISHLRYVMERFKLSKVFVIKSTHGYNAISLNVLPLYIIYQIGMEINSIADRDFFKYGYGRRYYVLRFDKDKKLVKVLKSRDKNIYDNSLAHKMFLEWFFNIKIEIDNSFLNNTKLDIIQYPSKKNGYHKVSKSFPSYPFKGVLND